MTDKKSYLRKKIPYLPKYAKFIFFRNPKEFIWFILEPVNPSHKIIVWGKLKKKKCKYKHNHFIKVGKIIIPMIFLFSLDLSYLIELIPTILVSYLLINYYFIMCNMESLTKCLLELRVDLVQEKLL